MRKPSKALFSLLTDMLQNFKSKFPNDVFGQTTSFPVLKGCDDYIERLSKMKLEPENILKTTLLTADFGDAYTETGILHIQNSVSEIGKIISWESEKIDLMKKLVNLVFSNCYFFTPNGLFKQTRGMPMGDVSSRDSLDIDLANSEFQIISVFSSLSIRVHLYCRLVDDISAIVQGDFSGVISLIELMASKYPPMPLNL